MTTPHKGTYLARLPREIIGMLKAYIIHTVPQRSSCEHCVVIHNTFYPHAMHALCNEQLYLPDPETFVYRPGDEIYHSIVYTYDHPHYVVNHLPPQ